MLQPHGSHAPKAGTGHKKGQSQKQWMSDKTIALKIDAKREAKTKDPEQKPTEILKRKFRGGSYKRTNLREQKVCVNSLRKQTKMKHENSGFSCSAYNQHQFWQNDSSPNLFLHLMFNSQTVGF